MTAGVLEMSSLYWVVGGEERRWERDGGELRLLFVSELICSELVANE